MYLSVTSNDGAQAHPICLLDFDTVQVEQIGQVHTEGH